MHINYYAKLSSYALLLKHLQLIIWRNEMIVFSFVVNSVISYLVTTQNSNSCPSFNHKCSAMFWARCKKYRIRGHNLFSFSGDWSRMFFTHLHWCTALCWMFFVGVPFIRSYNILHFFIWKSNVYWSTEQSYYYKYLLKQIKWFSVVVLKSLISMCGIMFIITQIQRQK